MMVYGKTKDTQSLPTSKYYSKKQNEIAPANLAGILFFIHACIIASDTSEFINYVFSDAIYSTIVIIFVFFAHTLVTPLLKSWVQLYAPIGCLLLASLFATIQFGYI